MKCTEQGSIRERSHLRKRDWNREVTTGTYGLGLVLRKEWILSWVHCKLPVSASVSVSVCRWIINCVTKSFCTSTSKCSILTIAFLSSDIDRFGLNYCLSQLSILAHWGSSDHNQKFVSSCDKTTFRPQRKVLTKRNLHAKWATLHFWQHNYIQVRILFITMSVGPKCWHTSPFCLRWCYLYFYIIDG